MGKPKKIRETRTPHEIYDHYVAVYPIRHNVTEQCWKFIIGGILDQIATAWRVEKVTVEVVDHYNNNGYKSTGIQRCHTNQRIDTIRRLRDSPLMEFDEFTEFCYSMDYCILGLTWQNSKIGKNPNAYETFDIDQGLELFRAKDMGWTNEKAETEYLKDLFENRKLKCSLVLY